MNRTDRLYAIVEELRAVAPRPRSARWLAQHFEVSARTIERDIGALQQTGTPIWAEPGRTGGYCLDPLRTLPPVNLTPQEAVAMAVALDALGASPFRQAAQSALRKLVGVMTDADAAAAEALARRVHRLADQEETPRVPAVIADALSAGRVLRIQYRDRAGATTAREVEPLGYVVSGTNWYLIGWCRLRDGVRAFRTDRIDGTVATHEVPPQRVLRSEDLDIQHGAVRAITLG
ncbi:helix-turn-helix transcriptional regulator [Curtobacterium sp. Leaf261]|uniref:helix-turn-helix transcriptional regulator n=1 Tax=Curtobacterium sp. Leaf261 TaxID=1736311 RepID=UPI0006F43381|nr:YafY family protein [Curtobacterium sp. Leaf261]KQO61455.1 transcriptional regulator [Curtobacterium sp. Leaf261]